MRIDFDKLTKGVLVFSLLLIAFSICYYYVIFLPQKEGARLEQQRQEQLAKEERERQALEQEHKEYVGKRKKDCYSIYEKERDKWNNVDEGWYDEEKDVCKVRYTTDKYKGVDCGKEYEGLPSLMLECMMGVFIKEY